MNVPEFVKHTTIRLVWTPITGQEAVWYDEEQDVEAEAALRTSSLYMIGARPLATFENFAVEDDGLAFDLVLGGRAVVRAHIDIESLEGVAGSGVTDIDLELGPHIIRVMDRSISDNSTALQWFTLSKLAMLAGRGSPGLERVVIPREIVTFDLLYVGIANRTDSFDRLIKRGHAAKQAILANEPQRFPGARVSDEIFLFFFGIDSMFIRMISDGWEPNSAPPVEQVVADLEKAFISQLNPSYNRVQYRGYPAGRDGLAHSGLDRYAYVLAEDLIFRTAAGTFTGHLDPSSGMSSRGDMLLVAGDEVAIVVGPASAAAGPNISPAQ